MTQVYINKVESEMRQNGKEKEAFESMLSRFNKKVSTGGILKDLKRCEFYVKPSEEKAIKHRIAVSRNKKKDDKNALHKARTKNQGR